MESYKTISPWKWFTSIIGMTTSIDGHEAGQTDAPAAYYHLDGSRQQGAPLRNGIYIRKQGGKSKKVIVRQR